METTTHGDGPTTFSEVEVSDRPVVVSFEDGTVTHLDRVETVLAASDAVGEEYLVYVSRDRITCAHFLADEPDGFGALLAESNGVRASRWLHLDESQVRSVEYQLGMAVALGIEDRVEEGTRVMNRARAFARGECIRQLQSTRLLAGFVATILISSSTWILGSIGSRATGTLLERLLALLERASDPFAAIPTMLYLAFLGGPLGGLIALTTPARVEWELSPHATTNKALLTGAMQIAVSVATSLVVLLAVRAGIAATGLVEAEPGAGYFLAAIAGGFGSAWATSILSAIGQREGEGEDEGGEGPES